MNLCYGIRVSTESLSLSLSLSLCVCLLPSLLSPPSFFAIKKQQQEQQKQILYLQIDQTFLPPSINTPTNRIRKKRKEKTDRQSKIKLLFDSRHDFHYVQRRKRKKERYVFLVCVCVCVSAWLYKCINEDF